MQNQSVTNADSVSTAKCFAFYLFYFICQFHVSYTFPFMIILFWCPYVWVHFEFCFLFIRLCLVTCAWVCLFMVAFL